MCIRLIFVFEWITASRWFQQFAHEPDNCRIHHSWIWSSCWLCSIPISWMEIRKKHVLRHRFSSYIKWWVLKFIFLIYYCYKYYLSNNIIKENTNALFKFKCRYGFRIHINSPFDSEVICSNAFKLFISLTILLFTFTTSLLSTNDICLRWWMMYNSVGRNVGYVKDLLQVFSTHLKSWTVISITWVLALSLALAPVFGWSYYEPESNGLR